MIRRPPRSTPVPYATVFRSVADEHVAHDGCEGRVVVPVGLRRVLDGDACGSLLDVEVLGEGPVGGVVRGGRLRGFDDAEVAPGRRTRDGHPAQPRRRAAAAA